MKILQALVCELAFTTHWTAEWIGRKYREKLGISLCTCWKYASGNKTVPSGSSISWCTFTGLNVKELWDQFRSSNQLNYWFCRSYSWMWHAIQPTEGSFFEERLRRCHMRLLFLPKPTCWSSLSVKFCGVHHLKRASWIRTVAYSASRYNNDVWKRVYCGSQIDIDAWHTPVNCVA